ncbi:MAG: (Fe-S)-binding protein [Candidatus Hydrogenedentota bacterium]|nr:MAG: (Fe-S)-binding protein [Candidatus Hydrogenedentota bacterium]
MYQCLIPLTKPIHFQKRNMKKSILEYTETCRFCMNMCRFSCPVAEAEKNEIYTPFMKMTALGKLAQGKAAENEWRELLWYCTNCNLCTTHCIHGIPVSEALISGRHQFPTSSFVQKGQEALKIERDEILSHWPKVAKKINALSLQEIPEGSRVFIPDAHAIVHKPSVVVKAYEFLQAKYPDMISMFPESLHTLELYELGLWDDAKKQLANLTGKTAFYVCQDPALAWALEELPSILDVVKNSQAQSLWHEELPHLEISNFQLLFSSYENRKLKEAYTKHEKSYAAQVPSYPSMEKQNPASDSAIFSFLFPSAHQRMIQKKWDEVIARKGDLICTRFWDTLQMSKGKPKHVKRKVRYLGEFLSVK